MATAITCVYCNKPLLDAEHAKKHVVDQCEASPSKKLADALEAFVTEAHKYGGCFIDQIDAARAAGRIL